MSGQDSEMQVICHVGFLGLAMWLLAAQAAGQTSVITDVTVIDPRSGRLTEHSSVVVTGVTITAIHPALVPSPHGARRIDGQGKFLIPGLWDAHVHLTKAGPLSLPLFVANGVTGVRDMGSDFSEITSWRSDITGGKRIGPRILTSGPILEASANVARMKQENTVEPVDRIRVGVANPEEGRAAVTRLADLGVDQIKMRTTPDTATFLAVAAEARRRNLPFAAHPTGTPQMMISAGLTSVEHFLAFPPLDKLTRTERRTLFEEMVKAGMFYSNTMVNIDSLLLPYAEAKKRVEDSSGAMDPRRKYVCGYLIEDWREQAEESKSAPFDVYEPQLPNMYRDLREMREAGVQFLAGSDVAVMLVYPGFSLHDELQKLVEIVGFTPMEALRIATNGPAAYFRRETAFGSLEAGQAADLVMLDANPVVDIANTRRIAAVMASGVWLDRSALDRLLADVAREAQAGCAGKGWSRYTSDTSEQVESGAVTPRMSSLWSRDADGRLHHPTHRDHANPRSSPKAREGLSPTSPRAAACGQPRLAAPC
jgi:Amidohydrolase family